MGLVQQPHTSAGRIPTDAGYRLFVDNLLRQEQLTDAERAVIDGSISSAIGGIDAVLEQTTRVLAELSNELGVTITPKLDDSILSQIELIPMAEKKVLVVLAFKSGLARTILVEVEASVGWVEVAEMSQVLNEKLTGLTLGQMRITIRERLRSSGGNPKLLRLFIDDSSDIWKNLAVEQMHYGGADKLINQPEFADRRKLQDLMKLLETRTELIDLFRNYKDSGGGIIITIGAENKASEIQSCSVVSATYRAGDTSGTIGIIGPTRMPYAKLASLVKYAARQLSKAFQGA